MDTNKPQIELTCRDALEIVSASFDGEASPSEVDALASHLVGCQECRLAAELLEADDDLLRRFGRQSVDDDIATAPMSAPAKRWLPWVAAAALALAVLGGFLRASFRQQPETTNIAMHQEPVSDPKTVADKDLEAELDRLTAQAETLIAQLDGASRAVTRQRANPFRARRSKNPFADSHF